MSIPAYDKVALLLPMDGANNGTVFADWGPDARVVTVSGDAKTSSAQSKFYGSSGLFDGSGDYLNIPNSAAFRPAGGDFTVECWVRFTTLPSAQQIIAALYNATVNRRAWAVTFQAGGKLGFVYSTAGTAAIVLESAAHGISTNTWAHVAIERHGSLVRFFVDGTELGSGAAISGSIFDNSADPLVVGGLQATPYTSIFSGHMQDLCITKGVAKYTGTFTPPARLVGEISGTITDENGDPAERRIVAFPRTVPARIFQTTSDDTTGEYAVRVPATEYSRIVLAEDAGTPGPSDPVLPDLIDRVIAQ